MTGFQFFKMAAVHVLGFLNLEILTANFVPIGLFIAEIWPFLDF